MRENPRKMGKSVCDATVQQQATKRLLEPCDALLHGLLHPVAFAATPSQAAPQADSWPAVALLHHMHKNGAASKKTLAALF